jgi:transcription termination factor NusB
MYVISQTIDEEMESLGPEVLEFYNNMKVQRKNGLDASQWSLLYNNSSYLGTVNQELRSHCKEGESVYEDYNDKKEGEELSTIQRAILASKAISHSSESMNNDMSIESAYHWWGLKTIPPSLISLPIVINTISNTVDTTNSEASNNYRKSDQKNYKKIHHPLPYKK